MAAARSRSGSGSGSRKPAAKKRRAAAAKPRTPRMLSAAQLPAAVARLAAPTGADRFAAAKALLVTAAKDPARLYPHFSAVAALLESDSKVLRWNGLQLLAALAAVDTDRRLDGVLDRYLAHITGGQLISAANAVQGAAQIARARPDLRDRIVTRLLAVEPATYETAECRNVVLGHVLTALADLGPGVCRLDAVSEFIRRQQSNPRPAVARRARALLAREM